MHVYNCRTPGGSSRNWLEPLVEEEAGARQTGGGSPTGDPLSDMFLANKEAAEAAMASLVGAHQQQPESPTLVRPPRPAPVPLRSPLYYSKDLELTALAQSPRRKQSPLHSPISRQRLLHHGASFTSLSPSHSAGTLRPVPSLPLLPLPQAVQTEIKYHPNIPHSTPPSPPRIGTNAPQAFVPSVFPFRHTAEHSFPCAFPHPHSAPASARNHQQHSCGYSPQTSPSSPTAPPLHRTTEIWVHKSLRFKKHDLILSFLRENPDTEITSVFATNDLTTIPTRGITLPQRDKTVISSRPPLTPPAGLSSFYPPPRVVPVPLQTPTQHTAAPISFRPPPPSSLATSPSRLLLHTEEPSPPPVQTPPFGLPSRGPAPARTPGTTPHTHTTTYSQAPRPLRSPSSTLPRYLGPVISRGIVRGPPASSGVPKAPFVRPASVSVRGSPHSTLISAAQPPYRLAPRFTPVLASRVKSGPTPSGSSSGVHPPVPFWGTGSTRATGNSGGSWDLQRNRRFLGSAQSLPSLNLQAPVHSSIEE
uniref:Uncharacterized protein n=1 Tax=Chromera velia CCMP2878 TaxID=1169474 RepID=A0A0G4FRL8_9ALVE|eukprot:Cvel_3645.t1-p1 / transcript=Cvel_3645.t1 / gene=Cvel_3645 / organism=Chromera_velia_CCMP2878 / gene_product=hypothetical protein / transcript_product=hypothetical protein / location=Cvel_scaffold150:84045-85637(-) / protein_length=531 / sequence_SO=supercontig / SO=protein_coding / is_pseudo=false